MSTVTVSPFGSWQSPITSDLIVADSISLLDVFLERGEVFWLEGRPREAGRCVLVRSSADGSITDINPAPFNARTRVHEYGGGPVVLSAQTAYFSNYSDQRLYCMSMGSAEPPRALTPESRSPDAQLRYADGVISQRHNLWIGVREDHSDPQHTGNDAINAIVAVDLARGGSGTLLAGGYDFVSTPRLSPDEKRLAWLAWNHPNMPWTSTDLWVGEFNGTEITNAIKVAGGPNESLFQPEWSPDGRLYFVSDRSGWWNLYRLEPDGRAVNVCPRSAEFGRPQWVFGAPTYAFLSSGQAVCVYIEAGVGKLGRLDLQSGALTEFELPFTEYGAVRSDGQTVVLRAGSPTSAAAIVRLDPITGTTTTLRKATTVADDVAVVSYLTVPMRVEFPTTDDKTAFGIFYPPKNPDYAAPAGERPPLVVKCHGGPTSSASSTLDLRIQYWTSRGIAVIDVDYGGSTGYGREYRDRLHLQWGVVDVDDCVAAARFLAERELIDPKRAVITGGSAGGFTTLACLTFRDYFRAGASYYGVSDPTALVSDTHKFEARYFDWLLGPYPEASQVYRERAPLHHADRLSVPVAFFQGAEDRVVPPNQTGLMVQALKRKGVPTLYLLFAGEQHGFRKAATIKSSLDAELYFYAALAFEVELRC